MSKSLMMAAMRKAKQKRASMDRQSLKLKDLLKKSTEFRLPDPVPCDVFEPHKAMPEVCRHCFHPMIPPHHVPPPEVEEDTDEDEPPPSTPPPPRSASVYTASAYTGSPASPAVAPSPIGSKAREAEAAAFEAEQEAWWRDEEARKHAETAAWRDEQRIREEQQRAARKAAASENASARRPFMAPVAGSGVRVEAPPAPPGAAQEVEPAEDEYEWWGVAATVAAGVAVIALLVVGRR